MGKCEVVMRATNNLSYHVWQECPGHIWCAEYEGGWKQMSLELNVCFVMLVVVLGSFSTLRVLGTRL